jgi:hypothetical protein
MKLFVRLRFWNVPEISMKDLARWLTDDSRAETVLARCAYSGLNTQ